MGIHTGPLIMGITGDDHRLDAAIISDTVNTASRVESLSKHYYSNILLSEASIKGVKRFLNNIISGSWGKSRLKGRTTF